MTTRSTWWNARTSTSPCASRRGSRSNPRHFVRVDVERPHMRSVEEGLNADGRIPKDRARYEAIHIQLKHVERT